MNPSPTVRRQLNVRFTAWFGGALLAAALTVAVVREIQVHRNAGVLLEHADAALVDNAPHQAANWLHHYLEYRPDDTDALVQYAQTLEKIAASPADRYDAYLIMDQALRRRPDDAKLREHTVRIAMGLYQFSDAAHHLQLLLDAEPERAEIWSELGLAREGQKQWEDAESAYREAVRLDPQFVTGYIRLANLLHFHRHRPSGVLKTLDAMVRANPDSERALLNRAKYLESIGKKTDAWNDVQKAWKHAPKSVNAILAKSRMEQDRGDRKAARKTLKDGVTASPKQSALYRALAWLEMRAKQPAEAIAWLKKGQTAVDNPESLRLALVDLLVSHGDSDAAKLAIEDLRRRQTLPAVADCLQARLWLIEGKYDEALAILKRIRPELKHDLHWASHAEYLAGMAWERLGDVEHALPAYRRAVKYAPDWPAARFGLASVLLAMGRMDEAITEFQRTRDAQDPPPTTQIMLARAVIQKTLSVPERNRSWTEAERELRRAANDKSAAVDTALLRAEIADAKSEPAKADDWLTQALMSDPDNARLWAARIDLARRRRNPQQARQWLDEAKRKKIKGIAFDMARARWLAEHGGRSRRDQLRAMEKQFTRLPVAKRLQCERTLAEIWRNMGEFTQAARVLRSIADRHANDLQSRVALFDAALHQRNPKAARRIVAELKRIESADGVLWRYGEAALTATFAKPDERERWERSRRFAADILIKRPAWTRAIFLEGWLEDRAGDTDKAVELYLRAAHAGELPEVVISRLVELLLQRRRFVEANQVLSRVQQSRRLPKDQTRIAVQLALRFDNFGRAERLARRAVPPNARDYRDRLWLAGVLDRIGKPSHAEDVLRELVNFAPDVPESWIALTSHLGKQDRRNLIPAIIADAEKRAPQQHRLLIVGRAYEARNDLAKAKDYLHRYAASGNDFFAWRRTAAFHLRHRQFAEAETWLRKIIAPQNFAPFEIADEARGALALALAQQNDDKKFQQALTLLTPRNGASESWQHRVQRARVLAQRTHRAAEAAALLQQAAKTQPLDADAQFTLAKLHVQLREYRQASKLLSELIATEGRRPDFLAPYIRCLIELGQPTAAHLWLTRLQRLDANHPALKDLQKRLN